MSNEISNERLQDLVDFRPSGKNSIDSARREEWQEMAKELLAMRRKQKEWTNEQCLDFLSIAFRHAEISGDIEMDDIRLGIKMVNAAAPESPC